MPGKQLETVQGYLTLVDITLFRYKAISSMVLMPNVLQPHWYVNEGRWDVESRMGGMMDQWAA